MKTKTKWMYQGRAFDEPEGYCGFVYLVTCLHPDEARRYIGRKFFFSKFGVKSKQKESDWRTYKTSSSHVTTAINKFGEEYFTFEILQLFKTKGGVVSGEVEAMWDARVLHTKLEDGTPAYWNRQIAGVRFIAKETVSDETRSKLRQAWDNPGRKQNMSLFAKKMANKPENKARLIARNKSGINRKIEDWQMLQVFELLEDGASHATISKLTGIPSGTIAGSLSRRSYKHQQELYDQWKLFNEDQPEAS